MIIRYGAVNNRKKDGTEGILWTIEQQEIEDGRVVKARGIAATVGKELAERICGACADTFPGGITDEFNHGTSPEREVECEDVQRDTDTHRESTGAGGLDAGGARTSAAPTVD